MPAGIVGAVVAASFIVGPGIIGTLASCGSATLTANPPSPHTGGGNVTLTATAGCGGYGGGGGYGYLANVPVFRFWIKDPGRHWSMVQDYSSTATHIWNTTGLANGDELLEVDVRSADEPSTVAYDTVKNIVYHIGPPPCTAAGLNANPASGTGHTGGTITLTGSSASCPNPVYKFWIMDPGSRWSVVQNYSATTTHAWGPVGTYHVGQYRLEVDVRDASEATTYDTVSNLTYNLVGCTAASITAVPVSGTVAHGAGPVVLTGHATCPGTATYRFWIRDPGGRWSMVQNYSTTATYTWAAGAQKGGASFISVDVRDQGGADSYEATAASNPYNMT